MTVMTMDSKTRLGPFHWIFLSVLLLLVFWVILKIFRRRKSLLFVLKHDLTRGHRWLSSEFTLKPTYCNSCMEFCVSGSYCETCGVCVCPESRCLKFVSLEHACKPLSAEKMTHSWRHGNLPLASKCFKCLLPCGDIPGLADYRCLWCQSTAHEDCVEGELLCSLGPHNRLIIPPNCVSLFREQGWRKGKGNIVVKEVTPPDIDGWRPLIVFSNTKSGGKDGEEVMSILRRLLNPIQVVDLNETPPEDALEICRVIPGQQSAKILVCGGDGTVGWVLGAIDKSSLPVKPRVGILPLGTGNDLARVLGWGSGYTSGDDISEILKEVEHAQLSLLDRWRVTFASKKRYFGLQKRPKVLVMNNYIGIGCGAGVALNFHRQRESRPELFTSRFVNKAWYLGFGARDAVIPTCKNLQDKIEVYINNVLQTLPEIEGIVVLNINSWSSGCSMWTSNEEWGPSRMDDKLLEVVGLYSSFHVGKIQISVAEPFRIGQSDNIKIVLKESVPVQVDGEPWQQTPSTINITHQGQMNMLKKVSF